jgi:hypothetical protein
MGLRQGRIAAHSWAVTRPAGVIQFKCIEIVRIDNGRIAERWANGIQSNSWSNSAHESVGLNGGLVQKEPVAQVRANRIPRLPAR